MSAKGLPMEKREGNGIRDGCTEASIVLFFRKISSQLRFIDCQRFLNQRFWLRQKGSEIVCFSLLSSSNFMECSVVEGKLKEFEGKVWRWVDSEKALQKKVLKGFSTHHPSFAYYLPALISV